MIHENAQKNNFMMIYLRQLIRNEFKVRDLNVDFCCDDELHGEAVFLDSFVLLDFKFAF